MVGGLVFRGITGCPWLNRLALFADPSCGEEHRALWPGMESKGRAIGLREPQRGSLIPPIEGQTRVSHQLVGSEPGGCFPARIAATISGARKASRTSRVA